MSRIKKAYIIILCILGLNGFSSPASAQPKEETQQTITQLQERLSQLNHAISTSIVQQEEHEQQLHSLNQKLADQEQQVTELTRQLTELEKEIQARLRAIQLKDADQKASFFQLENWTKQLSSKQGIAVIRKTDDARAKEYTALVEKLTKQQTALEQTKQDYQSAQKQLQTTMAEQSASKDKLEQELKDNQELLAKIQEEERQQELALKNQQEALWQQLAIGQSVSTHEELTEKAQALIFSARKYLGVPYVWGGTTPNGFDCSGLMQWVFAENGISLPRVSQAQQAAVKEIPVSDVQPGDLVFWGRPAHHVALYIGEGYFIQAPQPGEVVKITHSSYYPFESAGRVLF